MKVLTHFIFDGQKTGSSKSRMTHCMKLDYMR